MRHNAALKADWVALQRAYAGLTLRSGDRVGALEHLLLARSAVAEMIEFEPDNSAWQRLRDGIDKGVAYLEQPPAQRRRK